MPQPLYPIELPGGATTTDVPTDAPRASTHLSQPRGPHLAQAHEGAVVPDSGVVSVLRPVHSTVVTIPMFNSNINPTLAELILNIVLNTTPVGYYSTFRSRGSSSTRSTISQGHVPDTTPRRSSPE